MISFYRLCLKWTYQSIEIEITFVFSSKSQFKKKKQQKCESLFSSPIKENISFDFLQLWRH